MPWRQGRLGAAHGNPSLDPRRVAPRTAPRARYSAESPEFQGVRMGTEAPKMEETDKLGELYP